MRETARRMTPAGSSLVAVSVVFSCDSVSARAGASTASEEAPAMAVSSFACMASETADFSASMKAAKKARRDVTEGDTSCPLAEGKTVLDAAGLNAVSTALAVAAGTNVAVALIAASGSAWERLVSE